MTWTTSILGMEEQHGGNGAIDIWCMILGGSACKAGGVFEDWVVTINGEPHVDINPQSVAAASNVLTNEQKAYTYNNFMSVTTWY
jgi:hypothetical protein